MSGIDIGKKELVRFDKFPLPFGHRRTEREKKLAERFIAAEKKMQKKTEKNND